MSVRYYGPGEHPQDFVGFRVAVSVDGDFRPGQFSTRHCATQDDSCADFKRQRLKAEILNAQWMAESALAQYKRFVSANHKRTKKFRGLGVHALTATFYRVNSKIEWAPAFTVTSNGRPYRFTIGTDLFSDAWRKAVLFWGETHEILQEDIDRLLNNPPDPSQFKMLRRQMNDEGFDIPVEALNQVFTERRMQLASRKHLKTDVGPSRQEMTDLPAQDIASWFNNEVKRA